MRPLSGIGCFIEWVIVGHQVEAQAWQVFDMSNTCMQSNTVTDIEVQSDGVAWVATDWGLCRLEDGECELFQTSNSGIPDNVLRSLALDDSGRLWVGTSTGGAAVFDGATWEVLNTSNSPLPDDQVNVIHVDDNGWIWLGTVSGLACYTGSEWRIYDSSPSSYNGRILNGDHILAIDSRSDGLYALGTLNGGFHFLTDTSVHFFTTFNSGFWDNTQRGVLIDESDNKRWLACPAGGLILQFGDWYGGTFFQYTAMNSDLPSTALVDVAQGADNSVWLAMQVAGITHRNAAGSYETYNASNSGLPSDNANCILVAPDGAIWVGLYDGGAARFDPEMVGIAEPAGSRSLRIAPSLNDGRFRLMDLEWTEPIFWEVLDASGRMLANGRLHGQGDSWIDLAGLSPGSYQIRVREGGKSRIGRFVVH